MKVSDPPKFDGTKSKYYEWRSEILYKLKAEEVIWRSQGALAAVIYYLRVSDIILHLDRLYGDHHRDKEARLQYNQLKKTSDERLDAFLARFQRYVVFLNKAESERIADFINKLDDNLWSLVCNAGGQDCEEMEDLIELCREKERFLLDRRFRQKSAPITPQVAKSAPKVASSRITRSKTALMKSTGSKSTRPDWAPDLADPKVLAQLKKEDKCFDCGVVGCRPKKANCRMTKWRKDMGLSALNMVNLTDSDEEYVTDPDETPSDIGDDGLLELSGNETS
ncbi:hypothetical protein FOPE_10619 [Fonsecaea pedrosoi]|nr:hypothetical protein FOPE_10619 [Fonsecaea pedrosoi]